MNTGKGAASFQYILCTFQTKVFGPFIFAEGTVAGEVYLDILEQLHMLLLITHFNTSVST